MASAAGVSIDAAPPVCGDTARLYTGGNVHVHGFVNCKSGGCPDRYAVGWHYCYSLHWMTGLGEKGRPYKRAGYARDCRPVKNAIDPLGDAGVAIRLLG